jgi:hypothetical protein
MFLLLLLLLLALVLLLLISGKEAFRRPHGNLSVVGRMKSEWILDKYSMRL